MEKKPLVKSLFCLFTAFAFVSVHGQDKPFRVHARDKTKGYIQNASPYTLRFQYSNNTVEYPMSPGEKDFFRKNEIDNNTLVKYRYDQEDYLDKRRRLLTEAYNAYITLKTKEAQIKTLLQLADFAIDFTKPDTSRLIDDIKEFWNEIDDDYDILTSLFTKSEVQRFQFANINLQANESFYSRNKTANTQSTPIMTEYKESPFYRTYNPSFVIDFGWLITKQKLNDDWTKKGTKNSFSINAMLAVTPEINFTENIHSKLYLHGFYERLCFNLNKENSYSLGSTYIKDASNGTYPLSTNQGVDLCIKQLGAGLDFATIIKRVKVDFGAGFVYSQNSFLNFGSEVNYGHSLKTNKFTSVVSSNSSFPGDGYATFGLSIPWSGQWIERSGLLVRLAGSYQKISLKSNKGLDIHRTNTDPGESSKVDSYLPNNAGLFTLKLCFGLTIF